MLINFEGNVAPPRGEVKITNSIPQVRETLTVTPVPEARETRTTDRGKDPADWTAEDIRHYVVRQIETFYGEFPKDPAKIAGIFKGFARRHGRMAGPIAKAAFELHNGRWRGAPIGVTRFCQGSDPYFAEPIKNSLTPS